MSKFTIRRTISWMLVFTIFISMSFTSLATRNEDDSFDFKEVWNETKNFIQISWYSVITTESGEGVKVTVTWRNNGQGSKEAWYSLNTEDVINHEAREQGNKHLKDEIVLNKTELSNNNNLYILIQEGNGSYKKAQVSISIGYTEPGDMKAPVNMVRNTSKNQVLIDEEFTVNYRFQPQPIPAANILPETYMKDKDIVIVMDTSGSMDEELTGNNSRMDVAKDAARLFVNNLKDDERVNVALVEYSNNATIKEINGDTFVAISQGNNYSGFNNEIDSLRPEGGTNIGDGLRKAYYALRDSNNDEAKKYIVFLTDGEPTAYSFNSLNYKPGSYSNSIGYYHSNGYEGYVKKINNTDYKIGNDANTQYFVNWGSGDYMNHSLNYAKEISELIGNSSLDIESFYIAFSDGSNTNKLREIAEESNGYYKTAMSAEAINEVYNQLSEQIASDLPIHAINFEETFPNDIEIVEAPEYMEVNGQTVTGDIGSIRYNLNEEGTYFEADPFEFSIKLKAKETGEFILGADKSSHITYTDIDGTLDTTKYFPESIITVFENQPPQIEGSMRNGSNDDEYILSITIDESANIQVLDSDDTEIWAGVRDTEGNFAINIKKEDVSDTYIKIKAIDGFNNEIVESVPIVYLTGVDVEESLNENNKRNATINIQTESNSSMSEIKINDTVVKNNQLTNSGSYNFNTELIEGNNDIEITVENEYGNTFILTETILVEPALPEAIENTDLKPEDGIGNLIYSTKNGQFIAKITFTANRDIEDLEFDLGTDINNLRIKFSRLLNNGTEVYKKADINNMTIKLPQNINAGQYECYLIFNFNDNNFEVSYPPQSKKIYIENVRFKESSDSTTIEEELDPRPTIEIQVVEYPKIL